MNKVQIGQLLLEFGYVTDEQINVALEVKKIDNKKLLGEILISLAFVSPREIALAISRQSGKSFIDIQEQPPSKRALELLPKSVAKQLVVLPIAVNDDRVIVAMADPFDINAIDILKRRTGMNIEVCVSDKEHILKSIEINYFLLERPVDEEIKAQIESIRLTGQTGSVPQLIEKIINGAIIKRATDVHISPEEEATHIFYRIDGVMRHFFAAPKSVHQPLVSRIKVLSSMDIAEQRLPQDGSMSHVFFNENFDVRVSSIPTSTGENVVLRILGKNLSLFNLEGLGFEELLLKKITSQINRSQGIFLVTGPTGSGKTTTLYSALRRVNSLEKRVLTVEDPVEYKFPFIKQTQVNEKAGYNFTSAMRAFLRQDPDVILVGEMRDTPTAEMAMRAAITGHLVLSTIHTNDAVTAIPRLIDLGVKDYLIAAGVNSIIAQRLVRKICPFCSETEIVPVSRLIEMGFGKKAIERNCLDSGSEITVARGRGCEQCHGTGYLGRVVIGEILEMDEVIGDMIIKGATPMAVHAQAAENGMTTMEEDGLSKVLRRITAPEEVIRVVS